MNRLHTALPLRHPRTAHTQQIHGRCTQTCPTYSPSCTHTHTHTHRLWIKWLRWHSALSVSLSLSLSLIVRFCCRGNGVQDERRSEWEWGGSVRELKRERRGEGVGDGTGNWEIGESVAAGHVRAGLRHCCSVCDWLCCNGERHKHKECVLATWLGSSLHSAPD